MSLLTTLATGAEGGGTSLAIGGLSSKTGLDRNDVIVLGDALAAYATKKDTLADLVLSGANIFNGKMYGALGNNSADDTAAIQATDVAASSVMVSTVGAGVAYFPQSAGYRFTNLTKHSASWVGDGPMQTVLYFNGVDGTVAITQDPTAPSSVSYSKISNMSFRRISTVKEPSVWLDLGDQGLDNFLELSYLHFVGGTDGIKWTYHVNVEWTALRFDHLSGYALKVTTISSQNLTRLVIHGFDYDNASSRTNPPGIIHIDNTANASNVGTVVLNGGRAEINHACAANFAIFRYTLPASAPAARSVVFSLNDFNYEDNVGVTDDVVLYRDTANTTGTESLMFHNFKQAGLFAIFGGTGPAAMPAIPLQTVYGDVAWNVHSTGPGIIGMYLALYGRSDGTITDPTLAMFQVGDTNPRFKIDKQGRVWLGAGGATAPDVELKRFAADVGGTVDKWVSTAGLGVGNSAAATTLGSVTKKIEIFDTAGASLGFIPVYGSIT